MSKEEAELLGYHGTRCPYCKKEIYIPDYRQNPVTLEENQRFAHKIIREMKKKKAETK